MNHALRGRWKLSGNPYSQASQPPQTSSKNQKEHTKHEQGNEDNDNENDNEDNEEEGLIHIETEGADASNTNPKYIYKLILQFRTAGRGVGATRNNKLTWRGYWSYNKLTDDWAEFGLRNDKAFFWSRVRSYGDGE